jgi:hypothetical protein
MSSSQQSVTRRNVLSVMCIGVAALAWPLPASANKPEFKVWKDPSCGCCGAWVAYMRNNGFDIVVTETRDMQPIKAQFGVPAKLASCHTAEVAGYVIEGHVPAGAVERLLNERPAVRGLAVPGMPIGSPGMEGGTPEVYDVIAFGGSATSVFGTYKGHHPA